MLSPKLALDLHTELSTLTRAVTYQNLSEAASRIGVSQPQLSRIVLKIERELHIQLLDRSAKRKSGWLPLTHQLCEFYQKYERRFEEELNELIQGTATTNIKIGTLEGLSHFALKVAKGMLMNSAFQYVECDIYDLDELDRLFLKGDLDLIFTIREPSRRKYKNLHRLGSQDLMWVRNDKTTLVLSAHQYHSGVYRKWDAAQANKMFISNSLELRKEWLKNIGGLGYIPSSELKTSKARSGIEEEVYVFGNDLMSEKVWKQAIKLLD